MQDLYVMYTSNVEEHICGMYASTILAHQICGIDGGHFCLCAFGYM